MTCAAHRDDFVPRVGDRPAAAPTAAMSPAVAVRPGVLRRIVDAILESRVRRAEREAASYLEQTGGRITDDVERRIAARFVTGQWDADR
jgi:hypothetical protein